MLTGRARYTLRMSYEGGAGEFRIPDAVGGPVHGHEYYAEQGLIGKLEGKQAAPPLSTKDTPKKPKPSDQ